MVQQSLIGQCLLIVEASLSYSEIPTSVGFLCMTDQPDADFWQPTRDRHACLWQDLNPQTHTLDRVATAISLHLTNTLGHFLPLFQFIMNKGLHILIQSTAGNTGVLLTIFKAVDRNGWLRLTNVTHILTNTAHGTSEVQLVKLKTLRPECVFSHCLQSDIYQLCTCLHK